MASRTVPQSANNSGDGAPLSTATALRDSSDATKAETVSEQTAVAVDRFAGRVLSHYRLEERLGAGGMGVLYRATDLKLGRAVAIKLLARHLVSDETAKARFLREARAASALDHPNIGTIYEIGEHDGELFIAMALYEGETLKQRLDKGRLTVDEARGILRQVLLGLETADSAGIVHRDIKPANILVTSTGAVKILDFGLAKLVSDSQAQTMTQAGQAIGTVAYMSPEQLRGESVDARSDLWSLGVLAYETLSGVSPFQTDSSAATVARILHEEPPSLAAVPGVPDWLAQLVSELLRKNATERPQTASEVLRRLGSGDHARSLPVGQVRSGALGPAVCRAAPPHRPPALNMHLGRALELAQLCDGLADALQGRGRILLARGEAGIGKTRLAQELATRAISENALVLWGRCSEGEGAPPFWPWSQAIRACVEGMRPADLRTAMGVGSSYIAAIVPELKDKFRNLGSQPRSESGASRFQLFNAVRTFLARASRKRPILLVLDDLHWADHSSLLLLELLAQELANMSVLVVGTYREGELSYPLVQTLGELARAQLETVELRGLSQADVGLLLTAVTGERPPGDLVRLVHGHTGGNPFFVTEVARLLGKSKARFPIPDNVKSALSRRLSHLSDLANRLLIAASVIGRELELEVLERTLLESDRGEVVRALEETMRALIIEPIAPAGERYQFRHALIRDALYEELSPSGKARWHARVARALEEMLGGRASDRAVELAHHVVSAGRLMSSEKVVKYSTVAGQRMLTVHAHEEALAHFERAWKAREGLPLDADAATILFGLGYAQAATALRWNRQAAWANLRRALEYQIETGNIPQAVAIATHPCITPEGADGVAAVLDRLLEMVPAASREEGWLRSRWGAATYFETGDYARTQEAFERALAVATAQGDVALELRTLAYATAVDHFAINKQGVLSKSRRVIDLARRIDDLHAETYARYRAAYALMYGGSPVEARLEAEASLACAERLRDYGLLADALYANSALAQLTGDWSTAREHSDRGLALSPHQVALLHARMLLEYETGNSDAARDYLQKLIEADRRAGPYPLAGIFAAAGIAQAVRLEKSPAHLKISGMARALLKRTSHIAEVQAVAKIGQALFTIEERNIGQCAEALEHLAPLKGLILWPFLVTDRLCGLLAQAAGLTRRAATEFESALGFYRRAGYRPELAWTCYDYARLLLEGEGHNDREKASTLLAEARGIACELSMHPLATLVANFQERYRSRLTRKPAGLTDREVEILQLLVRGKTNKQMAQSLEISANTVAVHVARILRKTGSSNRTEAAAFANREHLVGAIAGGGKE